MHKTTMRYALAIQHGNACACPGVLGDALAHPVLRFNRLPQPSNSGTPVFGIFFSTSSIIILKHRPYHPPHREFHCPMLPNNVAVFCNRPPAP